jgi:hypothetical protein
MQRNPKYNNQSDGMTINREVLHTITVGDVPIHIRDIGGTAKLTHRPKYIIIEGCSSRVPMKPNTR